MQINDAIYLQNLEDLFWTYVSFKNSLWHNKGKQKIKNLIIIVQRTSLFPFNWIYLDIYEPATTPRFCFCSANQASTTSTTSSSKQNLVFKLISVGERHDSGQSLMNKGYARVIWTLNQEFFAWQHVICMQNRIIFGEFSTSFHNLFS